MKNASSIIILLIIVSCSSSKNVVDQKKCSKHYQNDFSEIIFEQYTTVSNADTVSYNEIRFQCVYSSFYTQKVMFDKFGKWDQEIYPINSRDPFLMWEGVDLFSNGKEYMVLANGFEGRYQSYASVMVFDEDENDVLSVQYEERDRIAELFAGLIRNQDEGKKSFYEVYWKTVDSERWNEIK